MEPHFTRQEHIRRPPRPRGTARRPTGDCHPLHRSGQATIWVAPADREFFTRLASSQRDGSRQQPNSPFPARTGKWFEGVIERRLLVRSGPRALLSPRREDRHRADDFQSPLADVLAPAPRADGRVRGLGPETSRSRPAGTSTVRIGRSRRPRPRTWRPIPSPGRCPARTRPPCTSLLVAAAQGATSVSPSFRANESLIPPPCCRTRYAANTIATPARARGQSSRLGGGRGQSLGPAKQDRVVRDDQIGLFLDRLGHDRGATVTQVTTRRTGAAPSPRSSPTLSQSAASAVGANRSRVAQMSDTVGMGEPVRV